MDRIGELMLNKLIKLLGGYTKDEYTAWTNENLTLNNEVNDRNHTIEAQQRVIDEASEEMHEQLATIAQLNTDLQDKETTVSEQAKQIAELAKTISEQEETIAKLKTGATKFTICVDGGKVWIE